MRCLFIAFLMSITLLAFCSCSEQDDVRGTDGGGDSQKLNSETTDSSLIEGVSGYQITGSEDNGQTFTKDFDGVVLTVTTDKSTYGAGEPIDVTAMLENKSDKDINLFYPSIPKDGSVELMVDIEHLIEDPIIMDSRAEMVVIIPVKCGEKYVQNYKFQTYTGIEQTISDGNVIYSIDYQKVAKEGVYNGKCGIQVCSNVTYPYGAITDYSLDFSVTLK